MSSEWGGRAPRATYRVQLTAGFDLDDAAEIAGYLADLGVSHLYASPYLQAAPGSTHGYDVTDPRRVNPELGGEEAHRRLVEALKENGLGQVLDIVPNHMSTSRENAFWWDVLENGPSSRHASWFDVDWDPPESKLENKVLLPVLGDHFGRVIEAGELRLERRGGSFIVRYHDQEMPLAPRSVQGILSAAARSAGSEELAFIAETLGHLPAATARDPASVARRHRDKEVLRGLLVELCREDGRVREALDAALREANADPDVLERVLNRQNYRLAFWRTAGQDLDYRRFFDINNLVGLRVEDQEVFLSTHGLVLRWVKEGILDGLRVDHPDGLRDPLEYLRRLRQEAPESWIVVEKILEPGEALPASWPVAGTTGYDFLNLLGGLFLDPRGEQALTDNYRAFTGEPTDFAALVREKKLLVLRRTLASDVHRLASLFVEACERHRRWRDYTRRELTEALRETIACFPVYRSYVRAEAPGTGPQTGPAAGPAVGAADARHVSRAVEAARSFRPDLDPELFGFLREILLLERRGPVEGELAMRFQQLTGPAMAKGVEDTAFYCYNRLVSLNEVGGEPSRFGISLDEFHRRSAEAQLRWPASQLATSTHDTKRSEDVRARLALLSEIPDRFHDAVRRWSAMNDRWHEGELPDANSEYLLYQTLVGAWPLDVERAAAYMEKASREAKAHTSWTDPCPRYDRALRSFVEGVLGSEEFVADLTAFVEPLVEPGRVNSLAQTLIKLTAPGVPDIYQGTELWDLSLVDPDNRRPVDFALRRRLLADLERASPEEAWARIDEGLPKLLVIRRALDLRRRLPRLFGADGGYRPLADRGSAAGHLVAFSRGEGAITLAPRLVMGLRGRWGDTSVEVPEGWWRDELTGDRHRGGVLRVENLLRRLPVSLLARDETGNSLQNLPAKAAYGGA